jgi:hypothetical protein
MWMSLFSSNVIEIFSWTRVSPSEVLQDFSEALNCSHVADGVSKHPNIRIRLLDWNDALEANPQGVFTDESVHTITELILCADIRSATKNRELTEPSGI